MNRTKKKPISYIIMTLLIALALILFAVLITPTHAFYRFFIDKVGTHSVMVELIFDRLDFTSANVSGNAAFNSEAEWGSAENPYIISQKYHIQNLSVLQKAGFFDQRTDPTDNTKILQSYFLVCNTDGTPVAIDCDGMELEPVGSADNPFTGSIGGAFATGADTYKSNSVSVSTIGNVTVRSKNDSPDLGFFGYIGYYGQYNENDATISSGGYAANVSDLLFADVTVSSQKSLLGTLAEWWDNLFPEHSNFRDVREETHHVGIIAGHAEFATMKNLSVYYSENVPAFMLDSDDTGSITNYYSSSGLIGLLQYVNPEIGADGTLDGSGGISDSDISGDGGGGGGALSGSLTGYMLAKSLYDEHEKYLVSAGQPVAENGIYDVKDMHKADGSALFTTVTMRERDEISWSNNNWESVNYYLFRDTVFTFAMSTNSKDETENSENVDYVRKIWNNENPKKDIQATASKDNFNYVDSPDATPSVAYKLTAVTASSINEANGYYVLAYHDKGEDLTSSADDRLFIINLGGDSYEITEFFSAIPSGRYSCEGTKEVSSACTYVYNPGDDEPDFGELTGFLCPDCGASPDAFTRVGETRQYECGGTVTESVDCHYMYNPDDGVPSQGIAAGISFTSLDSDSFVCPGCGGHKDGFKYIPNPDRYECNGTHEGSACSYIYAGTPSEAPSVFLPDTYECPICQNGRDALNANYECTATLANGDPCPYKHVVAFEDLPSDYTCPTCASEKFSFSKLNATYDENGNITEAYLNSINKSYYEYAFQYKSASIPIFLPSVEKNYGLHSTQTDSRFAAPNIFIGTNEASQGGFLASDAYTYEWSFEDVEDLGTRVFLKYNFNYSIILWTNYTYGWAKFAFDKNSNQFRVDVKVDENDIRDEADDNANYSSENYFTIFKITANTLDENGNITNSETSGNIEQTPKNIHITDEANVSYTFDPSKYVLEYMGVNPTTNEDEYRLSPIERYKLNNGSGEYLTTLEHIVKMKKATEGNYQLKLSDSILGGLIGDWADTNSGGVVSSEIGTTGQNYAIPTGMTAFYISKATADDPSYINIIVAINPEQVVEGTVGLWAADDTTWQKEFKLSDPDYWFNLPISKTASGPSDISHTINIAERYYPNTDAEAAEPFLKDDTDSYIYLGGQTALIYYKFTVTEPGIYLMGSQKGPLSVSYFSVSGAAGSGNDSASASPMGSIDFVYDYQGSIVTVDKKYTGERIIEEEDYNLYYPALHMLKMLPEKIDSGGGEQIDRIQLENIYLRRYIAADDTSGTKRHLTVTGNNKATLKELHVVYSDDVD